MSVGPDPEAENKAGCGSFTTTDQRLVGGEPTHKGVYLRWDELRHRTPPGGLTPEEWWLATKLARQGMLKALPLSDQGGQPIRFAMPDPVLHALHNIDRQAAGEIAMADPAVSGDDRDRYLVSSLIAEAITSSQLEGAATTREEAKEMLRSGRSPRDRSERMILDNYHVMEQIRQLKQVPFTPERVLELHRTVTDGTLDDSDAAGRFRRPSERVSVMDATHTTVLHQPPPARDLPGRLERLWILGSRLTLHTRPAFYASQFFVLRVRGGVSATVSRNPAVGHRNHLPERRKQKPICAARTEASRPRTSSCSANTAVSASAVRLRARHAMRAGRQGLTPSAMACLARSGAEPARRLVRAALVPASVNL